MSNKATTQPRRPPGKKRRLTESDRLFALEYLANGRNATEAWHKTHPKAKRTTCGAEGSAALTKPEIAAFIAKADAERQAALIMSADEALAGISQHARGDPRKLFRDGKLLPIAEWPDEVADCVKSIKPGPNGATIEFYNKLDARRLMAINGGKLGSKVEHSLTFPHLELLGTEPPEGDDE